MADYTPVFNPGNEITLTTNAAITGGQVVAMTTTAGVVGVAGLDSALVIGVAAHDVASGGKLTILAGKSQMHETASTGTIAAGDLLVAGAAGVVVTKGANVNVIGIAVTAATGGAVVRWIRR